MPTRICPTCKKEFRIYFGTQETSRKYCSRKCKRQNILQRETAIKNFSEFRIKNGGNWSTGKKCPEISARQMGTKNPCWKGGSQYKKGYAYIYTGNQKYRPIHRFIMEDILGRPLKKREVVHHVNGDRTDNRVENLQYFRNKSAHSRIHAFIKRNNLNPLLFRTDWEKIYARN